MEYEDSNERKGYYATSSLVLKSSDSDCDFE